MEKIEYEKALDVLEIRNRVHGVLDHDWTIADVHRMHGVDFCFDQDAVYLYHAIPFLVVKRMQDKYNEGISDINITELGLGDDILQYVTSDALKVLKRSNDTGILLDKLDELLANGGVDLYYEGCTIRNLKAFVVLMTELKDYYAKHLPYSGFSNDNVQRQGEFLAAIETLVMDEYQVGMSIDEWLDEVGGNKAVFDWEARELLGRFAEAVNPMMKQGNCANGLKRTIEVSQDGITMEFMPSERRVPFTFFSRTNRAMEFTVHYEYEPDKFKIVNYSLGKQEDEPLKEVVRLYDWDGSSSARGLYTQVWNLTDGTYEVRNRDGNDVRSINMEDLETLLRELDQATQIAHSLTIKNMERKRDLEN